MPVEIEAKMKVADHAPVRARLQQCGAEPAGVHLEINTFFDTDDRSLLASDKGLRVRVSRDLSSGKDQAVVTYKGPRQPGPFKMREELEFNVDRPQNVVALLTALGYVQALSFEKRRESWELDGCKVELDEVPYLGTFVEVEGPSEQRVATTRQKLGLANEPPVTASYSGLLTQYLQEHQISRRIIVFEGDGR